nr:stage II sporulation protein D [uncultured Agathobaculum sp.]
MRKLLLTGCALVLALYLFPVFWPSDSAEGGAAETVAAPQTAAADNTAAAVTDYSTVTVEIDGTPTELPLETYVAGVVAAEIPNDFPEEAIRAQAVAARTYAVYKLSRGRPEVHPNADLCDDYHHCAAYRDVAVETAAGGDLSRVQQAVEDTAGEILTYDGAPIAAVFHCVSGPRTEAARDVWGEDVPYLQSEVSPGGSAYSGYEDAVTVSADEFRAAVADAFPSADVSGDPAFWFKASVRSVAGGIITVQLGGVTVEGTAVRELFGLQSTNFTVTTTGDSITFHTIGYGHGVGLSQYGAKYMAEQGADYREILSHYYQDTSLVSL